MAKPRRGKNEFYHELQKGYFVFPMNGLKDISRMISAPQILAHYEKIYNFQPIFMKLGKRIISWVIFTKFQEDWPKIVDFLIRRRNPGC